MDHQRYAPWMLAPILLVGSLANGQDLNVDGPARQVTKAEWNRLRALAAALSTEDGTRDLFARSPMLGEAFSTLDYFFDYVAPWRPRLAALPPSQQEAEGVEVEVTRDGHGASVFRLTYHHEAPANAITIIKTVWQGETLMKLVFMKGFANLDYSPAAGTHRYPVRGIGRKGDGT
jgi:hypothetical protein